MNQLKNTCYADNLSLTPNFTEDLWRINTY